jgi:hypothetical protein
MGNIIINVYVKAITPNVVGFSMENPLLFSLSKNSTINDLLNDINKHRMPKNIIKKLLSDDGKEINNDTVLIQNNLYYIGY